MLDQGFNRESIAAKVGISPAQVSAVAAHRTMGTYSKRSEIPVIEREDPSSQLTSRTGGRQAEGPEAADSDQDARVFLGTSTSTGDLVYWNPDPSQGTANPHVLIVGDSGQGKTYAVSCLVAELAQLGIPSIIFDYGQGFSLDHAPKPFKHWAHAVEFELSRDGLALNPLDILPGDLHGPATVAQRVADTLLRVYPRLGLQQHSVIRRAVLDVMSEIGITQHDRQSWKLKPPAFKNIERKLNEYASGANVANRRIAASAASHVSALFAFDTFRSSGQSLKWSDLLQERQRVWILQIGGLESSIEQAVTEFLLWSFIRFVEVQGPGPLRCFVVLDEAHRLSFAAGSPIERVLREGRKFGLGAILASQQPEDFNSVAFANTATKIVFQVADDRRTVSKLIQRRSRTLDSMLSISDTIARLPRGCAYVVVNNAGEVVRIADFDRRSHEWTAASRRDPGTTKPANLASQE
jgi:DNA phosphorothioation-dependent restriction protein DptH